MEKTEVSRSVLWGHLGFGWPDIRNNIDRKAFEALLDAKLRNLRAAILLEWEKVFEQELKKVDDLE